ncbi:MAG: NPCBM/NEW2 domain-containing protein [Planctomycetota bacterium]|nr:NPCBM/NEW2 domain-containing protein [Planctomycetota bacterium]
MLSLLLLAALAPQEPATKVFLLAGQSNMVGYTSAAWVREHRPELAAPRDDVWCSWNRQCLPLAPGAGHEVGPELAVGHALGDAFDQPVLLVKYAVGGTTLREDWRAPSTVARDGGQIGYLYKNTLKHLHRVLARPEASCPDALASGAFEIAGFLWFQGENDCFDGREQVYEAGLRDLIADVRSATGTPELPVVVVQINDSGAWDGNNGGGPAVRAAQAAVAEADPLVELVVTSDLDEGYHYADGDHVIIGERIAEVLLPHARRPSGTDQAALAEARAGLDALFYPGRGPRPARPEVHVSDLEWLEATAGYGDGPKRDRSNDGNPLSVDDTAYAKGVGTHAESKITVALDPSWGHFVAVCGIDDEMGMRDVCSVVFRVAINGKVVAQSVTVKSQEAWYFDVPIPIGAKRLTLEVLEADSGINSDHADWVDAGFLGR